MGLFSFLFGKKKSSESKDQINIQQQNQNNEKNEAYIAEATVKISANGDSSVVTKKSDSTLSDSKQILKEKSKKASTKAPTDIADKANTASSITEDNAENMERKTATASASSAKKTLQKSKTAAKNTNDTNTAGSSDTSDEIKNEFEDDKAVCESNAQKEPEAEIKTDSALDENPEEKVSEVTQAFTGTFEINKAKDGKQYFFNLFASNKIGIASSQMYASAQSALTGVNSVIANAAKAPIEDQSLKTYESLPYPKWEIYVDNGGKYRFRLNAVNGSCVCHSQGYTTKSACKNGIESIIKSSRNPKIIKNYIKKKED